MAKEEPVDAQTSNIRAAQVIGDIMKTSLGKRGMDKMIIDEIGDITITNDGATIMNQMDIQHPAGKILVDTARSTDKEVGDGTTSTVVISAALLTEAEYLVKKKIHPTVIVDGYKKAAQYAIELLRENAITITDHDVDILNQIAITALSSKMVLRDATMIAKLVVDAVLKIRDGDNVDLDRIKISKKQGANIQDTSVINGMILDKELVHSGMPKKITDAKVLLLSTPLEVEKTETNANYQFNDPGQLNKLREIEYAEMDKMAKKIVDSGAKLVLSHKGIDDRVQTMLAEKGICAIRRIKEHDMQNLVNCTGGTIITDIEKITDKYLGHVSEAHQKKLEDDEWYFITGGNVISFYVRGTSKNIIDEAERSIHDAIMAVRDVIKNPAIVIGGGASESFLSTKIRQWSQTKKGREQLVVESFANALEEIPLILAETAGIDPLNARTELRSNSDKIEYGIDVINTKIGPLNNIYDPIIVKEQVINSATEAACMILRIDNIIMAQKKPPEV